MLSRFFKKNLAKVSEPAEFNAKQLTLRLKHLNFVRALQAHGVPESDLPLTTPLCGELLVSYALETPEQFTMATPTMLQQAGIALPAVHNLALQNLQRQALGHGVRLVEDNGAYLLRIGPADITTHLEAACLLLDGIWELLYSEIKPQGELLACVPTRDFLFVLDSAKPETHHAALDLANKLHTQDDTHSLSLQLMARSANGWGLWQAS